MNRRSMGVALMLMSVLVASPGWAKLVDLRSRDYSIRIGTRENLRKPIPEDHKCLLQKEVVDGLVKVQSELRLKNYSLRILRCNGKAYERAEKCAVAPNHNEGRSVDVSLVDKSGDELLSFDGYDPCSCNAPKKAPTPTPETKEYLDTLNRAMERQGFDSKVGAWWHFEK